MNLSRGDFGLLFGGLVELGLKLDRAARIKSMLVLPLPVWLPDTTWHYRMARRHLQAARRELAELHRWRAMRGPFWARERAELWASVAAELGLACDSRAAARAARVAS